MIEGPVLVAEALRSPLVLEEVLHAPGVATEVVELASAHDVPVRVVQPEVLARALDARTPPGVAAVAMRIDRGLRDVVAAARGRCSLVLADVADPGNAGTLVRAAEASGAGAVLFSAGSVDPTNPKCVRAAAGALFHLPWSCEGDSAQVLRALGDEGIRRIATTVRGGTPYDEADLGGEVALVLGNEAHGLPSALDDLVDLRVSIPMAGRSESLNVAMAGSVLCFEALRQRRGAGR